MNDQPKQAAYEQPEITESFDETEILGDAPEAIATHGLPIGSNLQRHEA